MNKDLIKIATLNLCVGLKNKKRIGEKTNSENKIDVLCLQETEIPSNFPVDKLMFSSYNFECESNNVKSRCGIYISNKILHVRHIHIKTCNIHVMVIDFNK